MGAGGFRARVSGAGAGVRAALRPLLLFGGALSLSITYLLSPLSRPLRTAVEHLLAWTTGGFLGWFDPTVSVAGSVVAIQGFVANIVPACTGLFTMAIFLSAVLALPSPIQQKLYGVLLGIAGILAFNWVRIVTLLLIGAYLPDALDFMHLVVWRSLLIFFALFLWLRWANGIAPHPRHAAS